MFCRPRPWYVVLGVALVSVSGTGQARADSAHDPAEARYGVRHWTTEHGLPQNWVRALAQTPDGYLWIGTLFGVARFDGVRFTVFDANNTPALVSDAVDALVVDAQDGSLWVGTKSGLARYARGRWEWFGAEHGFSVVGALCAAGGGGVWAGCGAGGVARVRAGVSVRHEFGVNQPTNEVKWLHERDASEVWIGLPDQVIRLRASAGATLQSEILFRPRTGMEGMAVDANDRLWLSLHYGALNWKEGVTNEMATAEGVTNFAGGFVWCDPRGGVWFDLRERGLHRFDPGSGKLTPAFVAELPDREDFSRPLVDREGNFWIGTKNGLHRLQPLRVQVLSKADGLGDEAIEAVTEGADGTVWLGTHGGISYVRAGRVGNLTPPAGRTPGTVRALVGRRDGGLWFNDGRPWVWTAGEFQQLGDRAWSHDDGAVEAVLEDRQGRIWTGRNGLVTCAAGGLPVVFGATNGLPPFRVRAIHQDRADTIWVGTYGGGLSRLEDGHFITCTTTNGELNNRVWAIHEDSDGVFWLGTQAGLNRFVPGSAGVSPASSRNDPAGGTLALRGQFFTFSTTHGLHENVINHVLEDEFGCLWFGGLRGIYRVARSELNAVATGRASRVRCVALGQADGMLTPETNGEYTPSACKTRDGRLWFPTPRGVVVVDPRFIEQQERETPLPPVVIEEVVVDGDIVRPDGAESGQVGKWESRRTRDAGSVSRSQPPTFPPAIRLAPGRARVLEVQYTANCFAAPERVRFRYRLERAGDTAAWVEAGTRRVAYFTNLKPGRYRFEVSVADHHGRWNEAGATLAFALAPHLWQTWTFYAIGTLALVGVAAGLQAHRLRVQRRILKLDHERALEQERTRIARDLHDDLGASLTGVALQLEAAQRHGRAESQQLAMLASETRSLAHELRELAWTTNPRCDNAGSLVAFVGELAERFCRAAGLECRLTLPGVERSLVVPARIRHELLVVVKESLANVAAHAGARGVALTLTVDDGTARVVIEDDGRGFDPARVHGGSGLRNLRERLQQLGGAFMVESRPARGTSVTAILPLNHSDQS